MSGIREIRAPGLIASLQYRLLHCSTIQPNALKFLQVLIEKNGSPWVRDEVPLLDNMKSRVVCTPDGNYLVGYHWTTEATETYSTEQEAQGCGAVTQALHAWQCAEAHLHAGCSS